MAGGPGKINEYNKSLTADERKKNARKAAKKSAQKRKENKGRISDIRAIARLINDAPAGGDLQTALSMLNLQDESVTNAAGIAMAVYQAALDGDMKAVEKWEKYVGQSDKDDQNDSVTVVIDV